MLSVETYLTSTLLTKILQYWILPTFIVQSLLPKLEVVHIFKEISSLHLDQNMKRLCVASSEYCMWYIVLLAFLGFQAIFIKSSYMVQELTFLRAGKHISVCTIYR